MLTCESCGVASSDVIECTYFWEAPEGDVDAAPGHVTCASCAEEAWRKFEAEHSPSATIDCPRCERPTPREDMVLVVKDRGACSLCPECAAGGKLPWEGRGSA